MSGISRLLAEARAAGALAHVREYLGFDSRAEFVRWLAHPDRLGSEAPDESAYGRWEEQSRRVPGWFLVALAEAAGLSYNQLLAGETVPMPPGLLERLAQLEAFAEEIKPLIDRLLEREERRQKASHLSENAAEG